MGLFLAIILGYFVVENIKDNSDNITKEVKKTQVERSIIVEKKSSVIKVEPELQKLESIEEVVNPELKKPDFQVSTKEFFCENESTVTFGDSDDYFYEEKDSPAKK